MKEQTMTPEEALNLLAQVASIYKGTLEEHTALQSAIRTINQIIKPTETQETNTPKE